MKTIAKSLLVLLIAATCTLSLSARDSVPTKTLKNEIKAMLKGIELPDDQNIEASVQFLINEDNQIVVVSIDTDQVFLERIIKNRLNYKEVESNEAKPNKINKVKLILKAA